MTYNRAVPKTRCVDYANRRVSFSTLIHGNYLDTSTSMPSHLSCTRCFTHGRTIPLSRFTLVTYGRQIWASRAGASITLFLSIHVKYHILACFFLTSVAIHVGYILSIDLDKPCWRINHANHTEGWQMQRLRTTKPKIQSRYRRKSKEYACSSSLFIIFASIGKECHNPAKAKDNKNPRHHPPPF